MSAVLSDGELTLLGLLAEEPRHGYALERVIQERGVRAWTSLGFSSIYYLLDRLKGRGLIEAESAKATRRSRTVYRATGAGTAAMAEGSLAALESVGPVHDRVLIGLANSPGLPPGQVRERLLARTAALRERRAELAAHRSAGPLPPVAAALYDHADAMLRADLDWTGRLLDTYLKDAT
ncbi:DNA-binding PadR family transcriptional regulator [Murinocardiopsis flavida]|uniref:DNA-binding PadR family transcriptional regulator n=1 Tax=Murinocardiopsis flavida TaxID=645275 RepID=A0A2P8CMM9_9ACTN|nr:PadR family transcriptional regulator [Murinocardiopsis flavida]PSK86222.1 DNA-binding PadR family transcriptional regulator [Murinocardiopsis flavida]